MIKTQQAPSPVQDAFVVPIKLASISAHVTKGGTLIYKNANIKSEKNTSSGEETRLFKIHLKGPFTEVGASFISSNLNIAIIYPLFPSFYLRNLIQEI